MALVFPQPERRKNRKVLLDDVVTKKCLRQNLAMRLVLTDIMNMTKAEMNDADFRVHVQDKAHETINYVERI